MPASPFSLKLAEQSAPITDIERVPAHLSSRISLYDWVVTFLLLDILDICGFGALPATMVAGHRFVLLELVPPIAVFLLLFVLLSHSTGVYNTHLLLDLKSSVQRLFITLFVAFAMLLVLGAATKTTQTYSRIWFFTWAALTCAFLPGSRLAAVSYLRAQFNTKGAFAYRALSVGLRCDPLSSEEIASRTNNLVKTIYLIRLRDFGALGEISENVAREDIDQIYVTVPWDSTPIALQHLGLFYKYSAEVFIFPESEQVCSTHFGVSIFGDRVSLTAVKKPIGGWDLWLKRMQDIGVSMIAIGVLSPIMLGIALAIKLDSPGPVLFRQKRMGFNGTIFELWKFRSMYVEHSDPDASQQTCKGDPRVTRVGRFIRSMSIDELPQFFNVLQGSMSVVGPRPHALETRAGGQRLEDIVESYAARHRVKPGLTGWAQINGLRGELDSIEKLEQRVKHDIEYIDRWSLWLDLKIIARTILHILYDPGAY